MRKIRKLLIPGVDKNLLIKDATKLMPDLARRRFIAGGASLGALTLLTGCDVSDSFSAESMLVQISKFNDAVQAAIFNPNILAPEFSESAITRPFPFNAYFIEENSPKIDGKTAMPEVDIACRRIADVLRSLGHQVETGQLPFRPEDIATARMTTRAGMAWLLRGKHWRGRTDDFYVGMTDAGERMTAVDYVEAIAAARRVQAAAGLFFRDYDLVLAPVSTLLPGPADIAIQGDYTIFTSFANIAGLPAISIPAELSSDGIPIGFQLTGRFGSDRVLLQIALQYEKYRAASGDTRKVIPPIERARL